MTDLLLISDVPRLSAIFFRLTDDKNVRLRVAASLEQGDEELAAEKPGIVFVQTHLSGLSAEILLMHLKKQLGRKRTKFVLLSSPLQAGEEALKLYQGHLDISLEDEELLGSIKSLISSLLTREKKSAVKPDAAVSDVRTSAVVEAAVHRIETQLENPPAISSDYQGPAPSQTSVTGMTHNEPSLADQGITYAAPRSRISVYSEFNSSFDTAVNGIPPAQPLAQVPTGHDSNWHHDQIEVVKPDIARSKRKTFLLWLAPVVVAVVIVTMLQHRRPKSDSVAVKPEIKPSAASQKPLTAVAPTTATTVAEPSASAVAPAQPAAPAKAAAKAASATLPSASPAHSPKPAVEPDTRLGDKSIMSDIGENRNGKEKYGTRPIKLPDFIPRTGQDKSYGKANPGWERYKGLVTEFKVFREGGPIRAIQIVDRGGNGIPESFMKGVLRQVSNTPAFVKETTEKKDRYEIQRGRVAENLTVVMYRDEQGGKLRAFVLTWR